jgi:hypothetical protein
VSELTPSVREAPKAKKVGNGSGAGKHVPVAAVDEEALQGVSFNLCPSCGLHTLAFVEGCALCFACGFSEC